MEQFNDTVTGDNQVTDSPTTPQDDTKVVEKFSDLEMDSKLLDQIEKLGFQKLTNIQKIFLPAAYERKSFICNCKDLKGKEAAYLSALANDMLKIENRENLKDNKLHPYTLILLPKNDGISRVEKQYKDLTSSLGLTSLSITLGMETKDKEESAELKEGFDTIIATPDALKAQLEGGNISLANVKTLVCDEMEHLMYMGFSEDIEALLIDVDDSAHKMVFMAEPHELATDIVSRQVLDVIALSPNSNLIMSKEITHRCIITEAVSKVKVVLGTLKDLEPKSTIIFTNTKAVADWLGYKLKNNGVEVVVLTEDVPFRQRNTVVNDFKKAEKPTVLITVDRAVEGYEFSNINTVINFDLPGRPNFYLERLGKLTIESKLDYVSLVCEDYGQNLESIRGFLKDKLELVCEWPKEEHLAIEDKAGNPYKDPEFFRAKGPSEEFDTRPSRDRKGGSGRHGRDRDNRSNRDNRDNRDRDRDRDNRGNRNAKGSQPRKGKGDRTDKFGAGKKAKNRKTPHKSGKDMAARSGHKKQKNAQKTPNSVGGLVKKFISVMFGRKKD